MTPDERLFSGELRDTAGEPWRTWLPWVLCATLFVLWIATITTWHLKDQLTEAAFLSDTRRDLLQAMQQVGQSLQTLSKEQQSQGQRLQLLEKARETPRPE